MKINILESLVGSAVTIVLLPKDENGTHHPLLRYLAKADRTFLLATLPKLGMHEGNSRVLVLPSGTSLLVIGTEERKQRTGRKSFLLARKVVALARAERMKEIQISINDFFPSQKKINEEFYETIATQFEIANFEFVEYKTTPPQGWNFLDSITCLEPKVSRLISNALQRGKVIGEEINKTRMLANMPGGDMTPSILAQRAEKSGKECGFSVKVLDEKEMKGLEMGGILGVSKGSSEKPRFIIMEYLKGRTREKPIVLVGKGVTFDTGGLNIKPENHMYEMHMDMSGGAAVIHTIAALARLGEKINLVGLVPAVENMPSGSSYRPGDILKTMSGKTIEVLNTDAEGRVILADALTYAKRYKPQLVVDVATLTGSAMSALGQRASALFSTDSRLQKIFSDAGEKTYDFVWPLPLWDEYEEEIKGTFGDVANSGKTRYGGAINGAVFLWQFIKDPSTGPSATSSGPNGSGQAPSTSSLLRRGFGGQTFHWVHLDIAPRMTAIEGEFLAKGATGTPVGLLTHALRNL